ncbi:ABC transporter permease [Rhodococcus sp. BP-349]|uniref:MlaE family ABC transporter permease n=1 Tax=unclassified Rhodococcus (in: high G+C Gram-positive bacteria) TaxID=192944 RepID=UPI001C9A3C80|nr:MULTISPECIES: ABC transporter permease [unclassified Rhodococcus (in: high G+C Gram-positive bacteria)]MBY6539746.1 ABC transporter permease [Rhodococcus sp. BP-363]MBY6543926.1 ABC transporter permease [Rhodococcus sp. BP-369]MBY6563156.1 ABC transporter permease [Rhodococcus sp. BP-370]MBY6577448.1 ABC transporter permease [Rhodococcus sp. BP-364]MBY6586749.1 ABC transporter permease [Rhodococcus sp. BP-358]
MTIARGRGDRTLLKLRSAASAPLGVLDRAGEQMSFYGRAIGWIPKTAVHYKKETLRLLAEVTFGSGALAVIGGTIGVILMMSGFTGVVVGLQGFAALEQLGSQVLTGFLSAYVNTREIAPIVASLALSATVGCGFTAQLGAMRISEEIDALEVMAVPSVPFLVSTRMIAGFIAVIPLYIVGLLSAYLASRLVSTVFNGQSPGSYDHYFTLFLPPEDVLYSFAKVLVFAFVLIMIHCYYGYTASGGPAGVGVAVGRAVRAALVTVAVLNFFLSLAIWGTTTTVRVAG